MLDVILRNWWVLVLRGVAAIIFAILAYTMPTVTLTGLVVLFGIYAIIDGGFTVATAMTRRRPSVQDVTSSEVSEPRWAFVIGGLAGIAVGLMTLAWPAITALALIYLIAAWAFVTGVFEIIAAVRLRKEISGEWLMAFCGVISILFAVSLTMWPAAGAIGVVWMIGAFAMVFGILLISLGVRMRSVLEHMQNRASPSHV